MSGISINKFISQTGICSRREADRWIDAGRVTINGNTAKKGNRVEENDNVRLDGKTIGQTKLKSIYIAFHKPPGITCTTDLRDKSNIIEYLNFKERIFPIGRLDKASTGLILLTNDGDIVNKILRTENNHEKEYLVTVDQPISERFVKRMSSGVPILGTISKECQLVPLSKYKFKITLTQGLNRQIRRMCDYLGYKVKTIKRLRVMNIHLADLKSGSWRNLSKQELEELKRAL